MEDETEEGRGRYDVNVFEQNALTEFGEQTVPLRLGNKVIGEATIVVDNVGARVVSTDITDPDLREMLDEFTIGPMHISYHAGEKEKD